MANRYYNNQAFTLAPGVVKIFASVSFGAAGAATLNNNAASGYASKGVVSVTHDGAGLYTFVFGTSASSKDVYYKLLAAQVTFDTSGASGNPPASPVMSISSNLVATPASCSLQVQFSDVETPAATDPANGEIGYFEFTLKNSTAP